MIFLCLLLFSFACINGEKNKKMNIVSPETMHDIEERINWNEGWVTSPKQDFEKVMGVHFAVEISNIIDTSLLKNAAALEKILVEGSTAAGMTVLSSNSVSFESGGEGATAFALLAESHASIHAWPEAGYAAVDVFTCGKEYGAKAVIGFIAEAIGGEVYITGRIPRGIPGRAAALTKFYSPAAALQGIERQASQEGAQQTIAEAWADGLSMRNLEKIADAMSVEESIGKQKCVRSEYQNICFTTDVNDGDVCLVLDNEIQICDSYNAIYSEVYAHLPIAFLPFAESAIIVGGGDCLLLQELLKYKSIKRIVQLELDPMVPKLCEEHFGVNCHLPGSANRDRRVEWRFGDAGKTLGYFETSDAERFDIAFTDISHNMPLTATSVNSPHFFSRVSNILKQHGVFIKHGDCLQHVAARFQEVLQVVVPCKIHGTHEFVIGSNGTSLLYPSFELFEREGIATTFLANARYDRYRQLRSMVRRFSKGGLNYEEAMAKKYVQVWGENPFQPKRRENFCSNPREQPCYEEHESHPLIVPLHKWSSARCANYAYEHPFEIEVCNVSPDSIGIYAGDMISVKRTLPSTHCHTFETFMGTQLALKTDFQATTLVTFEAVEQLITHPYILYMGLHTSLVARRSRDLKPAAIGRPKLPYPIDHDETMQWHDDSTVLIDYQQAYDLRDFDE